MWSNGNRWGERLIPIDEASYRSVLYFTKVTFCRKTSPPACRFTK